MENNVYNQICFLVFFQRKRLYPKYVLFKKTSISILSGVKKKIRRRSRMLLDPIKQVLEFFERLQKHSTQSVSIGSSKMVQNERGIRNHTIKKRRASLLFFI